VSDAPQYIHPAYSQGNPSDSYSVVPPTSSALHTHAGYILIQCQEVSRLSTPVPPKGNSGTQQTHTPKRWTSDAKKWGSSIEHPQRRCLPCSQRTQRAPQSNDRRTLVCFTAQTQALPPALSTKTLTQPVPETQICLSSATAATQGPNLTSLSHPSHSHLLLSFHAHREPQGLLSCFIHIQNSYTLLSSPLP